jgi:murein DD-endopeptidase MepM/ murein hydrolase activator NlpD
MRFPLPFVPTTTYKGSNGFGGNRDGVRKGLKHAANDLAAEPGTPVLAMDDGVVLQDPYLFFLGTYALEVRHPQFIARYCEIDKKTEVKAGDKVSAGQVIAYVGDQPGPDMLHLEFFRGTKSGNLSFTPGTHPPFDRRDDVFDGASILDMASHSDLKSEDDFIIVTEPDGRKFLKTMQLQDI